MRKIWKAILLGSVFAVAPVYATGQDTPPPATSTARAETKAAENKPADTKPADAKPADTKPAETKAAESKPAGVHWYRNRNLLMGMVAAVAAIVLIYYVFLRKRAD